MHLYKRCIAYRITQILPLQNQVCFWSWNRRRRKYNCLRLLCRNVRSIFYSLYVVLHNMTISFINSNIFFYIVCKYVNNSYIIYTINKKFRMREVNVWALFLWCSRLSDMIRALPISGLSDRCNSTNSTTFHWWRKCRYSLRGFRSVRGEWKRTKDHDDCTQCSW